DAPAEGTQLAVMVAQSGPGTGPGNFAFTSWLPGEHVPCTGVTVTLRYCEQLTGDASCSTTQLFRAYRAGAVCTVWGAQLAPTAAPAFVPAPRAAVKTGSDEDT